jgi:tRNA splicing endonuclease
MAIAALKQQRLIFSTREYIAVKRIVSAIKRKQGKSDNLFLELVFSAVRKQNMLTEVELEHDDYDLFADDMTKKTKFAKKLKKFAKRLGEAFKD